MGRRPSTAECCSRCLSGAYCWTVGHRPAAAHVVTFDLIRRIQSLRAALSRNRAGIYLMNAGASHKNDIPPV